MVESLSGLVLERDTDKMRICFDLDNTLCTGYPYEYATPIEGTVDLLRELKARGHTIIIQTARGMGSSSSNPGQATRRIGKLTFDQLDDWGFIYDEIYFGKPDADLFVDDKAYPGTKIDSLIERVVEIEQAIPAKQFADRCEQQVSQLITKLDSFFEDR